MALQPLGTLSYNGYDFASHGARTETTSVTVKPVPTSDGRTVRANRYAFAVRTVVWTPQPFPPAPKKLSLAPADSRPSLALAW